MYIKIIFTAKVFLSEETMAKDTITVGEFNLLVSPSEPYNEIIAQINNPRHLNSSHYGFFFIIALRDAMQGRYPECEMKAQLVNGEMQ